MENKKKGNAIKIVIAIIAVICIAVVIFFVSSNNTDNNNNISNDNHSSNNQEVSNEGNNNEVYTLSDTELKKYAELNFRHYYSSSSLYKIDKIERYEDCGNGRYIYVVYYYASTPGTLSEEYNATIEIIDASGYPDEVKISSCGGKLSDLSKNIETRKAKSDEELSWDIYDKSSILSDNSNNNNSSSNNSSSNTSSSTYLDDEIITALALKKWLEQDSYIKMQYEETIPSVYSGNISKNSDGSVNVHIVLYQKEIYEECLKYNLDIDGAKWAEKNIKLTKTEVTK